MIFKRKVSIAWDDIVRTMRDDDRWIAHPLTLDVLDRVPDSLEMHDGIIVATAMIFRDATGEPAPLITRDRQIRDSGLVQTVW